MGRAACAARHVQVGRDLTLRPCRCRQGLDQEVHQESPAVPTPWGGTPGDAGAAW